MKINIKAIRAKASGHWPNIIASLAPELGHAIKHAGLHVPCPVHGGTDGFRLFKDFSQSGGGICNSCGAKADGIELLHWVTGKNRAEIAKAVSEIIGVVPSNNLVTFEAPKAVPSCTTGKNSERLRTVWNESKDGPLLSLILGSYLVSRGLSPSLVKACEGKIKVHQELACWQRNNAKELTNYGKHFALISLVETMENKGLTIHRTYLDTFDGGWCKSTTVANAKTIMPIKSNMVWESCAIKLGFKKPKAILNIAEGIETSLAIIAMGESHCWSAINANNIAHFTPPDGIERIVLWADKDAPDEKGICAGAAAAERLRKHLEKLGGNITLEVKYPPMAIPKNSKGVDWLDYYNTLPSEQKK